MPKPFVKSFKKVEIYKEMNLYLTIEVIYESDDNYLTDQSKIGLCKITLQADGMDGFKSIKKTQNVLRVQQYFEKSVESLKELIIEDYLKFLSIGKTNMTETDFHNLGYES